jgi:hypothetical protein
LIIGTLYINEGQVQINKATNVPFLHFGDKSQNPEWPVTGTISVQKLLFQSAISRHMLLERHSLTQHTTNQNVITKTLASNADETDGGESGIKIFNTSCTDPAI